MSEYFQVASAKTASRFFQFCLPSYAQAVPERCPFSLQISRSTGARDVFPTALEDRLHQPYRYDLVPGLKEITHLRAPGLLGCALSGAGPSILVFHERGHESVCELVRAVFASRGHKSEIVCSAVSARGYTLA